jgi:hypothetical protein
MSAPNTWNLLKAGEKVSDDEPHGWIQWKGTDVCIDLHCKCGTHGHIDGSFMYQVRCEDCGQHYAVGQNVVLVPVSDEVVREAGQSTTWHPFKEDD